MSFVAKDASALHLALIKVRRGIICPVCGTEKEARQCFCKTCYFGVKADLRGKLYTPLDEGEGEFELYYIEAMAYLFKKGMHRKYSEWPRPVLQRFAATGLIEALMENSFVWMRGA